MKLKDLIHPKEYISSDIDLETEISSVCTSAENISDGCLYILENPQKAYLLSEIRTNPLAVVAEDSAAIPDGLHKIKVKNSRLTSSVIHSRFWGVDYENLKVIGVTGTNGKTSTATMIYRILSSTGHKVGFIGTGKIEILGEKTNDKNYSMTTPDSSRLYKTLRKMQDEGCDIVVMEVSSHALELEKVTPIPFEYGVFTNLSPEHTDFHKTMEDYYSAKKKLLQKAKRIVINIDDYYGRVAAEEIDKPKITAGVLWRGNIYATNIENRGFEGISYYFHAEKFCYKTTMPLPGLYNVYNSMLAAAVCTDMGIAPCLVKKALSKIRNISGRFEVINDKIKVIIDYAHTTAAFENIMKDLSLLKENHDLTVVFGCGGERDKFKRPNMAKIAEKYADKIIVTEDNSRGEPRDNIIKDIIGGFSYNNYRIIPDRRNAIREAIFDAKANDIVAIIGKGCEEYNIDKNGYHDFSEKEIINEAISEHRENES